MGRENSSMTRREGADRLLQDHLDLRALMAEICATSDLTDLLARLGEFRKELTEHFRREEAPDGFGAVVEESAPHKSEAVARLFEEHREFMAQLDELTATVEDCISGPVADVRKSAGELCGRVREHEAREHELLTDSLYTDIGGG